MTSNIESEGFSFGQHFTCACCGEHMTTAHKGLRHCGFRDFFLLPLSPSPDVWHEQVATLKEQGFEEADLCGKCHL